jgi:hypothetical protein
MSRAKWAWGAIFVCVEYAWAFRAMPHWVIDKWNLFTSDEWKWGEEHYVISIRRYFLCIDFSQVNVRDLIVHIGCVSELLVC